MHQRMGKMFHSGRYCYSIVLLQRFLLGGYSKRPRPEAVALRSPPKGGETRTGRPRRGLGVPGKPRWGCATWGKPRWGSGYGCCLLEQLTLLPLPALLLPDVLADGILVPPDR